MCWTSNNYDTDYPKQQFNCSFLARALPGDVIARARVLKSGRRLVVMQVEVSTTARDDVAAFITGSYVLP